MTEFRPLTKIILFSLPSLACLSEYALAVKKIWEKADLKAGKKVESEAKDKKEIEHRAKAEEYKVS